MPKVYIVWCGLTSCGDEDQILYIKSTRESAQKLVDSQNALFDEQRKTGRSLTSWLEEWDVTD